MGPPLVTGATGFAGRHLLRHLLEHEPEVAGWANPSGQSPDAEADGGLVRWSAVDLLDRRAVAAELASSRPSVVYHLAGMADVAQSWTTPVEALRVNVLGTHHVLDGLAEAGLAVPILVTGSALVYRQATTAIGEDHPVGPATAYGLSKLAQEMRAQRSIGHVLLARPFNHAGPGQSDAYVTSSFARQLAEIEAGLRPPVLHVGNLEARRDITDVRDTVRAYRLLVERGRSARPYNICTGTAYRVRDLLDALIAMCAVTVRVEQDPKRLRPSDNPVVLGDANRIAGETGWRPEIPIDRTLADLLQYWRHAIRRGDPAS